MFVLGLTGSIGMGKSTVAAMLAGCGARIHDADHCVHRLYGPGGAAVGPVGSAFPGVVTGEGRGARIDRQRLGARVLGDAGALARLEALVHPLVRRDQARFLRRAARNGCRLVVFDVPLLFETGGESLVDATCVVHAPPFIQAARVLRRPGMTRAILEDIRRHQMPDRDKLRRADHVVRTGLAKGHTWARVHCLWRRLSVRQGRIWPP
ncbi:MAG: dephospho-CoA kinase [Alphaproteobacteria bacterium]|nr:dephospho-CoA kinase [Alphaproteobacteria bacterium]